MGTRLNALDIAFLGLETQRTPVNVGALQIFEIPKGYRGNFVRNLLKRLGAIEPGPPFNLKLSHSLLPLAVPQWVVDQNFDLDYHVRHSALPKPGTTEDLLALVSRLHSRVMDRQRPLWEFHLIEGLKDRRFAVYTKMHHAAIDGLGGVAIMEGILSSSADAELRAPWQGVQRKRRESEPGSVAEAADRLARMATRQAQMGADLGRLLLGHTMKPLGLRPDHSPVPFSAPRSILNGPISGARRFCVQTLPLPQIKALGADAGATVNDIILAICSGALRRYLLKGKALPERGLIASVPVSIRHLNRSGNQITYVAAKLATHRGDPMERLREISESTRQAKQEVAGVTPAAAITFAVMAQGLVAVLNRLRLTDWVPPPANVVISNVPGPRKPLYFDGAKMLANYPLSVLVDGQALNITVMSYVDSVDFGVMACRDTLPDATTLTGHIRDAFEELVEAVASHAAGAAPPSTGAADGTGKAPEDETRADGQDRHAAKPARASDEADAAAEPGSGARRARKAASTTAAGKAAADGHAGDERSEPSDPR